MNKTKKIIFDSAIKLFSQKGFHKSTMDQIAETAGVAKGTLYYHFKSKEDIFKFIIEEGIKIIENEIRDRTDRLEDPIERLRMICKVQLELVIQYIEFFKTVLSQMWGDEERQHHLRNIMSNYFKLLEKYIIEASDRKDVDEKNVEIIAFNFFGVMVSTVVYSLIHKDVDLNELIDSLIEFTMKGIGNKK